MCMPFPGKRSVRRIECVRYPNREFVSVQAILSVTRGKRENTYANFVFEETTHSESASKRPPSTNRMPWRVGAWRFSPGLYRGRQAWEMSRNNRYGLAEWVP